MAVNKKLWKDYVFWECLLANRNNWPFWSHEADLVRFYDRKMCYFSDPIKLARHIFFEENFEDVWAD